MSQLVGHVGNNGQQMSQYAYCRGVSKAPIETRLTAHLTISTGHCMNRLPLSATHVI
jgi:hypothetical protein